MCKMRVENKIFYRNIALLKVLNKWNGIGRYEKNRAKRGWNFEKNWPFSFKIVFLGVFNSCWRICAVGIIIVFFFSLPIFAPSEEGSAPFANKNVRGYYMSLTRLHSIFKLFLNSCQNPQFWYIFFSESSILSVFRPNLMIFFSRILDLYIIMSCICFEHVYYIRYTCSNTFIGYTGFPSNSLN